ncbi:MAG: hypothetical protein RMM98_07150 [Acidobacteriota bacterium]|nr:hypothetical protein [Blastocatellia bacterium]MDW8239374.1 hypothetical protein [Acidobacteriota bacterium]
MAAPTSLTRDALAEALVASLEGPLPEGTPRRVSEPVHVPGKGDFSAGRAAG